MESINDEEPLIQNDKEEEKEKKEKSHNRKDKKDQLKFLSPHEHSYYIQLLQDKNDKLLWYYKARFRTHLILHHSNKYSKVIEWTVLTMIIINVAAFVINTDENISKGWVDEFLNIVEYISVGFFTLEYILRLWCVVDKKIYRNRPWYGRLRFIISPFSLIDLASIVPFYVALVVDYQRLEFSTALRIFRVFRLLKVEKYSSSFGLIGRAILEQKEILLSTLFLCSVIMVVQSTLLYFAMRHDDPKNFGSIPTTMWFSVLQVTGVGGYESVYLNGWAKFISGITAFTAVAIFAVPVGVIANGFLTAFEIAEEILIECPKCNHSFTHEHRRKPELP